MKFNVYLPGWRKEFLEDQYKEYIKKTPMNKREQRALREWVKDGNSVYENPLTAWQEGQAPVEFLTVWRDGEYIRTHTKGMPPEDARKFALDYYGWNDMPEIEAAAPCSTDGNTPVPALRSDPDAELPFTT